MQLDSSILGALRGFEAAGRLASFTKAASSLNLTQSAVSQQIRQLEERLGYPLFVRQPRGLALTDKGAALFEATTLAFAGINRTLRQLSVAEVPLQVSCLPSFALQWLMPRLTEFHRQHPDIPVRLRAEFQTVNRHELEAEGIDVAIRYDPGEYDALHAEVILDEFLFAVATPQYLEAHPPVAASAWFSEVVLLHDTAPWAGAPEFVEWRTWIDAAIPERVDDLDGPQFNLSSLAISAAQNHQGVAMGRSALVHEDIESGRLSDVFHLRVSSPARYVFLCRQPDDPRVTAFAAWLRAECKRFAEARGKWIS